MGNDITDRTQAEEELRKALQAAQARNAQYEQAVSMISDIVWRYDVNTKGEHVGSYISPVADRMLGLPIGTIGDSFEKYFSYVHPDDLPAVQKILAEWIRTFGKDKTAEYRMQKSDGTMFWVRSKGSAYGRFSVYGTTSEITERKQAEEALRESEERFRTIFENNSAAMAIIERDTTISKVNREYCRLSLFEEKDLVGISWTSQIHPEDLGRLLEYNQKRLLDPKSAPEKYEFKFYRKDGKIRHCLMSVAMIPTSQQIVCSFADITDRKRAEEALRQEKELAQLYLEIVGTIIIAISSDHTISLVNQAGCRLLGYPEDEIIGTNWFSRFLPARARADVEEIFDHLMAGIIEPVRHVEGTVLTRDSEERIVSWHNTVLRDEAGNITGTLSSGEDITERKKAEEKIASSEALLNATLDSIPDIIGIQNPDHKIARYNRAGYEFLNLPEEEVHGRRCYELIGRNIPCEECATEKALKTKKLEQTEKYLPEYGVYLDCRSNPVLNEYGEIEFIVEQLRDITERKRTEMALRESEARYKRMVETANEGIMIMDDQFRYAFVNQKLANMLGYQPEEMLRQPVTAFIFEEDLPDHKAMMEMRVSGAGTQYERRHRRKDGSCCYTIVSATPLNDETGQFAGSFAMLTDISDRKHAEQELQQTNQNLKIAIEKSNELAEQARKANAAKSQFLANMSHEIRTPLNGVIGMIGLLQDTDLNAEQNEYAQIAHKSGETLLSLINDILDFSKIEACKLKLEKLNFDLHSTLKDIADLLALSAHEKRLELVCLVEPNVPSLLRGDPGRLRQILLNLGTNAVKFTDKGEMILIRTRLEREDERNVTIRFSVSDTGIGIPANRQDILFSPFTQVDGSTTRQYGGTGLGLAISKQLARLMGGKIGLESEVGKGSTFWFTAVFEKQPAGSGVADEGLAKIESEESTDCSAAKPSISENDKRKIHILVVEDNPVNQKVAQAMMRKMGLRADVVANGQEAVNALETIPYDLVFMDCHMPEMDGFEATRCIRQQGSKALNPHIPIVAMTASTMQGDRDKCIQAGMNDFIAKPVQIKELAEMLARWLAITTNDNLQSE
jgi:PAS domain S-box-containing protein